MAIIAILASLFGCGKNTPFEPQILDGPGMEYVDSEYRNDYANCLPFDDIQGEPYLAVAYLGKGEIGKENKYGIDLYAILGLFNTSIINWFFKLTSSNNHVNNYEIDCFPVPIESPYLNKISSYCRQYLKTTE